MRQFTLVGRLEYIVPRSNYFLFISTNRTIASVDYMDARNSDTIVDICGCHIGLWFDLIRSFETDDRISINALPVTNRHETV